MTVRPLFLLCSFFQSSVAVDLRAQTAQLTVCLAQVASQRSCHQGGVECGVEGGVGWEGEGRGGEGRGGEGRRDGGGGEREETSGTPLRPKLREQAWPRPR